MGGLSGPAGARIPGLTGDRRRDEDFDPRWACLGGWPKPIRRKVGPVLLSLAAAMVAALCYGVAAVMQAMAARAASPRSARMAGGGAAAPRAGDATPCLPPRLPV